MTIFFLLWQNVIKQVFYETYRCLSSFFAQLLKYSVCNLSETGGFIPEHRHLRSILSTDFSVSDTLIKLKNPSRLREVWYLSNCRYPLMLPTQMHVMANAKSLHGCSLSDSSYLPKVSNDPFACLPPLYPGRENHHRDSFSIFKL